MSTDSIYYREKILKLFNKLFLNSGDARSRFIDCENELNAAYHGSMFDGVPLDVKEHWEKIWKELNRKEALELKNATLSPFNRTVYSKRNKTLVKYLEFISEEYSRLICWNSNND